MNNQEYLITPNAELSLQRNALRVEIIPPEPRCMLCPKTDFAALTRARFSWRTDQLSRLWDDFDYCTGGGTPCKLCPVFAKHQGRTKPPLGTVIRPDPAFKSTHWLLPNREKGWNAFGYWYKGISPILSGWAIDIIPQRKQDEFGTYFEVVRDEMR